MSADLTKRIDDWEIQTIEREDLLDTLLDQVTQKLKEAQTLAEEVKNTSNPESK